MPFRSQLKLGGTVTRSSTNPTASANSVSEVVAMSVTTTATTAPIEMSGESIKTDQQLFVSLGSSSAAADGTGDSLQQSNVSPGIESRPGNVPGSRRLHLASTGRLAAYSASVPASGHGPTFAGLHKPLLNNGGGAAMGSVSSSRSSLDRCVGPTMLQQSHDGMAPPPAPVRPPMRSIEVQATAPCCLDAKSEISELKEANSALKEEADKGAKERADLSARLKELEVTCGRLKDENVS